MRPCGATVAANIATMIAIAAGANRRLAIAFSTSIQVSSVPNAMIGSGRRPLLNGSHAARNTAPAVHTATLLAATARPSRLSTQRRQNQPAADAGERGGQPHPHAGGADRRQLPENALIPVERRLGRAEVPVVVREIPGAGRHPRDDQVVAVVGGDRADEMP